MVKRGKGYRGLRHRIFTQAKNAFLQAGQHAYRGRKLKKRQFRTLWISRINAACREEGISYSRLMYGLLKANIIIDRKMLADLAVEEPKVFAEIVQKAKAAL